MTKIAIVYFSVSGHTEQLAHAIADGAASSSSVKVTLHRIVGADIHQGRWKNETILEDLNQSDAIVFGTPTYMGGYASQFKSFIDACGGIWYSQGWKDKIAAGFTHSQGLSGDKLNTLQSLMVNALQHSMIWVGNNVLSAGTDTESINRLAAYGGVLAQSNSDQPNLSAGDRQTATHFGQRIAVATNRWIRGLS